MAPHLLPCLWCGAFDFVPWLDGLHDRLGHVPGTWGFARCTTCRSGALRPFPRREDVASFYPPAYTFSPEIANKGSLSRLLAWIEYALFYRPIYDVQVGKVSRAIGYQRGRPCRLLDVGCGRGLRLTSFARKGYDVAGIDFDEAAVEYVRDHLGFPAICGDVDAAVEHFAPGSFDVVTAFYVLEHVLDVQDTLAVCQRLLKPGGWLAAAVPLSDSVQAAVFGTHWGQATEIPRHVSLPSRQGALRALTIAGFEPPSLTFVPDTTMACASVAGSSLFPQSAVSYVPGRRSFPWARYAGAAATLAAIPWALADALLFQRPAMGIIFAHRPGP